MPPRWQKDGELRWVHYRELHRVEVEKVPSDVVGKGGKWRIRVVIDDTIDRYEYENGKVAAKERAREITREMSG